MVAFRITFKLLVAGMLLLGSAPWGASCPGQSACQSPRTTCCAADGRSALRGTGCPDCRLNAPQEQFAPFCVRAGAISIERESSSRFPPHRALGGPSAAFAPRGRALRPAISNISRSPLGRPLLVFCHVLLS